MIEQKYDKEKMFPFLHPDITFSESLPCLRTCVYVSYILTTGETACGYSSSTTLSESTGTSSHISPEVGRPYLAH